MKYYVAGSMRKIELFNFPAFDAARDRLLAEGHDVVSPADIDRCHGFDPMTLPVDYDWSSDTDVDMDHIIPRDLLAILECEGIYLLKGWMDSVGAFAEWAVAMWAGKTVRYEEKPCLYTAMVAMGKRIRGTK